MDIKLLYRDIIMDHYKDPKHKGLVNDSKYLTINLNNPTCGDKIIVQLLIENNLIKDLRHDGVGCSICCASASVASLSLIGKTLEDALDIINEYYEMIKGNKFNQDKLYPDALAFQTVHNFPARIKCATLAWEAYKKGIKHLKEGNQDG
ncbi:MAG: SUF system NifU family Fe-S cluster assembly protein [Acholeplasmataceae bacterium]